MAVANDDLQLDVDALSNEEIRDELIVRGQDPGPVVEGTRKVYANKLRRLIKEGSPARYAAAADTVNGSSKHAQAPRSPAKSNSATRITRATAHELSGNVSTLPLTPSKVAQLSQPESELAVPVERVVPLPARSPPRVASKYSPPDSRSTPEPLPAEVIRNPAKVPESYVHDTGSNFTSKVYRTTPTTRFTSLRAEEKERSDSDDDFRGEESSRYLSSSRDDDHMYAVRRNVGQGVATRHSPRLSNGVFQNSYGDQNAYAAYMEPRSVGSVQTRSARRSYGRICFALLMIILLAVFILFIMQNYATLINSEGNKEEV